MRYQNRKKREVTQLALDKVENAIELRGITKTFGSVVANDHIDLDVRRGEILALLGENGSGKTTLMNMISGIYHPDEGSIHVNGREVVINSPMDAKRLGIGMIHQHFKLVDVFSAMDNVVIGAEGKRIKPKELKEKILELTKKFGLEVEPEKKIYNMSVSEKQTVEILKVLYRNADILILDEPTAGLDPKGRDEILDQIASLHSLRGITVILVSHSMEDIAKYVERMIVMNKGEKAFDGIPREVFSHYKELEAMGLAAPQITYIMHALRERGLHVDTSATTVEEAKTSILQALERLDK